MAWKGPVFEISALNREGCQELVNAIYLHLEEKRNSEHRAEETQMTEEARGIASIDPDDPRFKILGLKLAVPMQRGAAARIRCCKLIAIASSLAALVGAARSGPRGDQHGHVSRWRERLQPVLRHLCRRQARYRGTGAVGGKARRPATPRRYHSIVPPGAAGRPLHRGVRDRPAPGIFVSRMRDGAAGGLGLLALRPRPVRTRADELRHTDS